MAVLAALTGPTESMEGDDKSTSGDAEDSDSSDSDRYPTTQS